MDWAWHFMERELLDEGGVASALGRIADAVRARNGQAELAIVGIRTGGLFLAHRLQKLLGSAPLGAIDIALYRDDVLGHAPRPVLGPTELPFEIEGRTIVLVDDVLFTGRTVRAALDALVDYGRPRAVQLAVLVDRGCRELPIQPDFAGLVVETTVKERVRVCLKEKGDRDRVVVGERLGRS
jgi:pyrimidine operon attenuation protein/uracil phosphoribosyltransferase